MVNKADSSTVAASFRTFRLFSCTSYCETYSHTVQPVHPVPLSQNTLRIRWRRMPRDSDLPSRLCATGRSRRIANSALAILSKPGVRDQIRSRSTGASNTHQRKVPDIFGRDKSFHFAQNPPNLPNPAVSSLRRSLVLSSTSSRSILNMTSNTIGSCCFQGVKHEGQPHGRINTVGEIEMYVVEPDSGSNGVGLIL